MGGLLYKDFVTTCKLKKINMVWVLVGLTMLYAVLRICLAGMGAAPEFLVTNDNGETINLLDVFFVIAQICFILNCAFLINSFVEKITESDDRNKIKGYLRALPLGRYDYIASKYIFIGITAYVLLSFQMIWSIFATGYCREGIIMELSQLGSSLSATLTCFSIFMAAIELPLFLIFGKEKAMLGKITVIIVIALLLIGYVLFGDLSVFNNMNIEVLIDWFDAHNTELSIFSVLFPLLVMMMYFGSYKLACKMIDRRER